MCQILILTSVLLSKPQAMANLRPFVRNWLVRLIYPIKMRKGDPANIPSVDLFWLEKSGLVDCWW
jgi:hypothetical protein